MSKSRLEWKVGLFALIGIVLLLALLLQFSKGMTLFRKTYQIYLRSENVGGLKSRASVLMAGVEVGRVGDIRLSPDGKSVRMTLLIYGQHIIHKDARFVLEQSGFLGDQFVAILPTKNQGEIFKEGDEAAAEAPFNMQEVARTAGGFLQRIDETVKGLNEMIVDVRRLLFNTQTLTNVAVAAENLRSLSDRAILAVDDLRGLMATNAPAIAHSGSNLVAFSEQMNQFAGVLRGVVETNRPTVQEAVKNIESSTVVLKNLMEDLQAGKGPAGNLLRSEQLATSLSQIGNNLSITTSNLNRLGLWGILWQHKPSRTNVPPSRERLAAPKERDDVK
jgi:phospholipid/cholesterol/gamma-HCH transport system substrate-binding protein